MGKFQELLLKGDIPYPTQRKFTLSNWEKEFSDISGSDEIDKRLYDSGIWVFNKLEFIRNQITEVNFSSLTKEEMIQALFGFVNRDSLIIEDIQKKQTPPHGTITEGYFNKKVKFHEIGPEISIVDKFESTIEAIKYPLLMTFNSTEFSPKKQKVLNDSILINHLHRMVNYGQYYLIIENIWGDCLWKNYFIEVGKDYDIIKTPININTILQAVGQFRVDSNLTQSTFLALKIWKDKLTPEFKKALLDISIVQDIRGSGKFKKYIVGKYDSNQDTPPNFYITELHAHELYFNNLLGQRLPKIPEITLRELFKVCHLFSSFAIILKDRLPQDTEVLKVSKLRSFSTHIKKNDLINLISTSIKVNNDVSEKIILLFTYSGKNDDELWTKPFYEHKERLYFSFGTLLYPNLLRSIEHWIRTGGLDLSDRGSLFEEYVRSEIKHSCNNSKIIKNIDVFPKAIKINDGTRDEEIDLIFWIRNNFIICELKCIVFPSSPIEHYRYQNRLNEAALQINRKKIAVENNKTEFLTKLSLHEKFDESKISITPLIITNLLFGSGKIIEGVSVTDLLILNKYIRDGEMPLFVERSLNAPDKPASIHKFYNNEQEAIENFIKEPPILKLYSSLVEKTTIDFPRGNEDDKGFVKEILEVRSL